MNKRAHIFRMVFGVAVFAVLVFCLSLIVRSYGGGGSGDGLLRIQGLSGFVFPAEWIVVSILVVAVCFAVLRLVMIILKDDRSPGSEIITFLRSLDTIDPDYRQLLNIAPIGIIQTDYQGRLIFANPVSAQIAGFSSVEDFKKAVNESPNGLRDFYVNQERRDDLLKKLYNGKQVWVSSQEQFYRQDGTIRDMELQLSLRHDASKGEDFIVGFFHDVTRRLANERKLKVSEKRFRDLINQANSIILKIGLDGRMTYVNEYAQKFFGYSAEEIENRFFVGSIQEDDKENQRQIKDRIGSVCRNPDEFHFYEEDCLTRDQRRVWIQWSVKGLCDDQGKIFEILMIGTDLTQKKRLEASLKHQIGLERIVKNVSQRLALGLLSEVDQNVRMSLNELRGFFAADCLYFYIVDDSGSAEEFYSSPCEKDCSFCRDFAESFFLSRLSWWRERFRQDGASAALFHCDDQDLALEGLKKICRDFSVSSVAIVPIFDGEEFVGFIGMNFGTEPREKAAESLDSLKICAEMIFSIIKKKAMQDELLRAKERLDLAVRGGYLGMYDWEVQSGKIFLNDIWFRMLGYSPHALPHTIETWHDLIHPEDKERVLKMMNKYLCGEVFTYREEFRMKTKGGDWKWIQNQGHVIDRDEEGHALRMIGLHRDITELKTRTQELARHRDMFRLLIENMPVGVFVKDIQDEYRFVIWNRSMNKIFGFYRDEVLGKTGHDLFETHVADMHAQDDRDVVRRIDVRQVERKEMQTAEGKKRLRITKVPILDERKNPIFLLGIVEDLTDQYEMEQQLRQSQKMQSVGQLAAGIAHEVKNPLAIIQLAAEGLLVNKKMPADDGVMNKIRMIKRSAMQANNVILELLKFSRFSDEELEWIDLHRVIENALLLSRNRDKDKTIDFKVQFLSEPVLCLGGEVLLEQVFVNLLNNAVDAIEHEGEIFITTEISEDRQWGIVRVQDSGCGIPEEILSKIFDPFFTTKEDGLGTGLGLSTIFMIIQRYKGDVVVESREGQGACFIIRFPYRDSINEDQNS